MKNTKREWEKIATDARKGLIVHHGQDISDEELVTMTAFTFYGKCDEAYERGQSYRQNQEINSVLDKRDLKKKIEGMGKECRMCSEFPNSDVGHDLHIHTYNQALQDVLRLLDE